MSKCTSEQQAIARYGAIDFSSATWPNQSKWMQMIQVPKGFPNWKVSGLQVQHIYCNQDMAQPLMAALTAIAAKPQLAALLHTYDGCFNIRPVRGVPGSISCHAYGLAIDLNANENVLGSTHGGFYTAPALVKCFTDQGFDWGGNFHGRKDPMHFSYAWE